MAEFMICNKWTLEIDDDLLNTVPRVKGSGRPYLQFVNEVPNQVGAEAWAIEWLISKYNDCLHTDDETSVAEYLGGIGMTATIIRNTLDVSYHVTNDWNDYCYKHLNSLYDYDDIYQSNWMDLAGKDGFDCDLVHVDFNSFTIHQLMTRDKLYGAWESIFGLGPDAVIITDSATTHLHLNHTTYEKYVDFPINSIQDYVRAMSAVIHREFGYGAIYAACHTHAICVLFRNFTAASQPPIIPDQCIAIAPTNSRIYFRRV